MHSYFSDGVFSPEELIDQAISIGLAGISITDHDTLGACQRASVYAKEKKFAYVHGVELSTFYKDTSVHVLAYNFDPQSSLIADFCEKRAIQRVERARKIFELLRLKASISLDFGEFMEFVKEQKSFSLGRPHIAMFLQKKAFVESPNQAFQRYIGDSKPCYYAGKRFSLDEVLTMIHQSGAKAVLAHPHLLDKKVFPSILQKPFDGIEAYYAKMSPSHNAKWVSIAKEKAWLMTGGSDFHGPDKPINEMGSSYVREETFEELFA